MLPFRLIMSTPYNLEIDCFVFSELCGNPGHVGDEWEVVLGRGGIARAVVYRRPKE